MIKIICIFLVAICLPLAANDNQLSSGRPFVSILKVVTSSVPISNLTSPLIDSTLLQQQNEASTAAFCDKILQSINPMEKQQLLEKGKAFSNLPLKMSQEILFHSLLRWSQQFLQLDDINLQLIYPPICLNSYTNFYHPLGLLIANNFRQGHPSLVVLRDSCLQSLTVFQSLWDKRDLFSRLYMLNKMGASRVHTVQTQRLLAQLPDTITTLEGQDTFSSPHYTHRVAFQNLPPEILEDRKLKRSQTNHELHYMVTLNKAIRSIASQSLKTSQHKTDSKEALWEEMHKQDQLANLITIISSELLLQSYQSTAELINNLTHWQSLFNFAQETLELYPPYSVDNEQSLGLFLILKKIIPMAYCYVERVDFPQTVESVLEETSQLEEIVEWAHLRLTYKGKPITYENLIEEIEMLSYIFCFSLRTLSPSQLIINIILEDMVEWEQQFDFVLEKLKKERRLEGKTTTEIYDLLEEEIVLLIRTEEEDIFPPAFLEDTNEKSEETEDSFRSSYSNIEGKEAIDKKLTLGPQPWKLEIGGPFEALYRKSLNQSLEI